jgi:hypothetical protein
LQNDFKVKTLPKLENNIRVSIEIVPFTNRLNKLYLAKEKHNQNLSKVAFIDSLPSKPELVTIRLLDVSGFTKELNADYNTSVLTLISNTPKTAVVTSIAASLSTDDIAKIRQADSYYLSNVQVRKYTISLYKLGKIMETININSETIIGYRSSQFCWGVTGRGQWYIADITEGNNNCEGKTKSRISEKKKTKSLFNM